MTATFDTTTQEVTSEDVITSASPSSVDSRELAAMLERLAAEVVRDYGAGLPLSERRRVQNKVGMRLARAMAAAMKDGQSLASNTLTLVCVQRETTRHQRECDVCLDSGKRELGCVELAGLQRRESILLQLVANA